MPLAFPFPALSTFTRLLAISAALLSASMMSAAPAASPATAPTSASDADAAQTTRVYLSGTDKDNTVPWEFRVSAGRRAGEWATVPVPGCWEMHGFGTYRYGSWGAEDEFGEYRKTFDVPAAWAGRRVFVVFEGAMTEAETLVNGQPAGGVAGKNIHRGGFYEFSHEITDQVKLGASNLLEVTVRKVSANAALNTAERKGDYWNFGGLFRPVYLESRPAAHIERIAVNARHDGAITVDVFTSGLDRAALVTAQVRTLAGLPVGTEFSLSTSTGEPSTRLASRISGVAPWSHEFPNRYRLEVVLRDPVSKKKLHVHEETIGFRTVTFVKNEGFYLNGSRVRLVGTSHHEFWPTTGRTSSRAQHAADLELMKAMNMNLVRRAHYPASREFYEEADRIGMLVFDELGGWQNKYGDEDAARLCRSLVTRNVNHPSVIAWGNGNEGGWNTTVDTHFSRYDPQNRIVIHPANWDHEKSGLKTHHYSDYKKVLSYLGTGKAAFMPTENLHALFDGGGGAGLHDYWEAIRQAPNGAGLLIWAFVDETLFRDDWGRTLFHVGDAAPDGIVGPYREKEASFHTARALWNPVQITATGLATGSASATPPIFTAENRLVFTDLSRCTLRWQLGRFPAPTGPASDATTEFIPVVDSGSFAGPALAPGASGPLELRLPAEWRNHEALRLTVTDPNGREFYTWTWPLLSAGQTRDRLVPATVTRSSNAPSAKVRNGMLTVTAGAHAFRFNLATGRLMGASVSDRLVPLADGPRPVAGEWPVTRVTHGREGKDYVVTVNPSPEAPNAFRWRVRSDGWLRLDYRYTLTGAHPWLGVTFDYPEEEVTAMRWLGRGPDRVWKNRLAGPGFGVHRKTANNANTGQDWIYPEFRGYHADLRWAVLETKGEPLTLVTSTPDLFLRVLSWPDAWASRPGLNIARPPGNLSLLHGINGIGHKFGDAASLGPMGEPNQASGRYTGVIDLYFGTPPAASAAPAPAPAATAAAAR